jgi:hypothetical protein
VADIYTTAIAQGPSLPMANRTMLTGIYSTNQTLYVARILGALEAVSSVTPPPFNHFPDLWASLFQRLEFRCRPLHPTVHESSPQCTILSEAYSTSHTQGYDVILLSRPNSGVPPPDHTGFSPFILPPRSPTRDIHTILSQPDSKSLPDF